MHLRAGFLVAQHVGAAGATIYEVGAVKDIPGVRKYVSVNGGMSDNPRYILYGAEYEALLCRAPYAEKLEKVTIVGKHCESGDILIKDAKMPHLKRGDIIAEIAPDIKIESRALSRAKQLEEREMMTQYMTLAFGDPTANRRYGLRELGKLSGMGKDQLDRLFPPTIDERIAEAQNELLNQNKTVPVLPEDDHNVHLEIHTNAKDTDATYAHIETHKKALSIKKTRPELFPAPVDQQMANFQTGQGQMNPVNNAAPAVNPVAPSKTSGQM